MHALGRERVSTLRPSTLVMWLDLCPRVSARFGPVGILDRDDYTSIGYQKVMVLWHTIDRSTPLGYVRVSIRRAILDAIRAERLRLTSHVDVDSFVGGVDHPMIITEIESRLIRYKMEDLTYTEIAEKEGVSRYCVSCWFEQLRSNNF